MSYTQVTLATLRSRLQTKWEDVPFWVDAEANLAINEALQWYGLYTGVWRQRVVIPTVADQVLYTLPVSLIGTVRVDFNGKSIAMASLNDLDNGRPTWQSETTATSGAPSTPTYWAPVGMLQLALWPADAVGQNSLTIDGMRATPILTDDNAKVDLDASEVDPLLGEALHIAAFKDPALTPRTAGWHQEFLRTVLAHNSRLNASDAFRQAAGVDTFRQQTPPTTPVSR